MASAAALNTISEAVRERETFRYDSVLIANTIRNDPSNLIPSAQLRTSSDESLTAFAELAALRLRSSRALISLFDSKFQYIVAEATQGLALTPGVNPGQLDDKQLWLSGTALPRSAGVCEHVLDAGKPDVHPAYGLAVSVIDDLLKNPDHSARGFCHVWPHNRFYAGVPLRTRKGINIGVLCVFDSEPRPGGLDAVSTRFMQDLARVVVRYLDAKRSRDSHRRADRMVRGVGSFVEGTATMSSWETGANADAFQDNETQEGALNLVQQDLLRQDMSASDWGSSIADGGSVRHGLPNGIPNEVPNGLQNGTPNGLYNGIPNGIVGTPHQDEAPPTAGPPRQIMVTTNSRPHSPLPSIKMAATKPPEDPQTLGIKHAFSKAANIIRESIEVESVMFLDASVGSFGGLATSGNYSSSSSDEKSSGSPRPSKKENETTFCPILGFSTSIHSSIDGATRTQTFANVPERFLAKLLRRYPEGKIFHFDENGSIQSSDVSGDDFSSRTSFKAERKPSTAVCSPLESLGNSPLHTERLFTRQNTGKTIARVFPGARCVALFPLWDVEKQRWFAGGFACTKTPTRAFTTEGELSYLRAFGTVVMGEVARVKANLVHKAKNDLLSSLSHELRSPLHGIILGSELLRDTPLDAFQGDALHSVETCGRTLLDTIDHLLDWSKINNFTSSSAARRGSTERVRGRGQKRQKKATIEAGMMSITSNVEMDVLVEEVVESVCAGHRFQRLSAAQHIGTPPRTLGGKPAKERMPWQVQKDGETQLALGDVTVGLDVEPGLPWTFHTQPGAVRRIIMNLLGNSLKYTTKGFVKISLGQETRIDRRHPNTRTLRIMVTDSGRGIGEDYLRNHLFSAFTQEDNLAAGTGVGLSLVKKVATSLGGSTQVWSKVDSGTVFLVRLPMELVLPNPLARLESGGDLTSINTPEFESQVRELRGLRVSLLGFSDKRDDRHGNELPEAIFNEQGLLADICRRWLHMSVIDSANGEELLPDFILCHERYLDQHMSERSPDSSTPTIVTCPDALIARQLSISPRFAHMRSVFEFISQPMGPRKLAKMLLLSFQRWTRLQTSLIPTPLDRPNPIEMVLVDDNTSKAMDIMGGYRDGETNPKVPISHQIEVLQTPPRIPSPPPALEPSSFNPDAQSAKFLLVDDNSINLKILGSYMKRLGYTYDTAADGQQALDAVRDAKRQYKCIFMDISMPVMDGFEATRLIRGWEGEQQLPRCSIFALSGLASATAQQEAFASGIDLFLTKPVQLKELNNVLSTRNII